MTFIVFEGIDGSGKSTQAQLLYGVLQEKLQGWAELTYEPTATKYRSIIRHKLANNEHISNKDFDWEMSLLFALDRREHLYDPMLGVVPMLEEGYTVICDRYILSSFAYNGQGEMASLVAFLNKDFPVPDLTIYIDIDVDVALQRIAQRGLPADAYEQRLYHYKAGYEAAMQSHYGCLGNIVTVDGDRPVEEVHREILSIVNSLEK